MLASLTGSYLQHFTLGCFEMSPTQKKKLKGNVIPESKQGERQQSR